MTDIDRKLPDRTIFSQSVGDAINPDHYKVGGIETIAFIQAKLSPEEFAGYCRGNMLKYISRAGHKADAAEDMRKALWYGRRWLSARDGGAEEA